MRNNKRYYTVIILLIMVLVMSFTGCQLAIDEDVMSKLTGTDTLIGAFVTIGSLGKQIPEDVNATMEISNIKLMKNSNGTFTIDNKDWALLNNPNVEGYLFDENDKKIVKFDGMKGYFMGLHRYVDADGEKYTESMYDDKFHNSQLNINISDKGEEKILEVTLSVGMNLQEVIYLNPVYLRSDGTYYTKRGGYGFYTSDGLPGSLYSQSINITEVEMEEGVFNSSEQTFKVNINIVDEVKQIFIKEMNRNNELIKVTEYLRDDPEEYSVAPNTEYIIVEDIMSNDSNETIIKRSIYNIDQKKLDDTSLTHPCNFSEEDNILGGKSIRFVG